MQVHLDKISEQAHPIILLSCETQDLGQLISGNAGSENTVRLIRGHKSLTKQDFFNEASAALQFPLYFGENWDAFDECINDLSWIASGNLIVVVANADQLLSNEAGRQLEMLVRTLGETAENWASGRNKDMRGESVTRKFKIILQHEPHNDLQIYLKDWANESDTPNF